MLETKDLILKSGDPSDWVSLYENFWSQEAVFTYMFQKPCASPQAAQEKTAAYAGMHREVRTEFFIYSKETGHAIGVAGLKALSPGLYTITDIAMGPDYWHRGYGRQILLALTRLGFELGAEKVLFNCFLDNTASRNLALSCGYQYVRTEEAELKKRGQTVWLDYFEIRKAQPCA